MRATLITAVAGLGLLGAVKAPKVEAPSAKRPYSAIWCQAGRKNESSMFLAKERSDGRLQFYLSHWLSNGALTGDQGIAEREGDHWVYDRPVDKDDLDHRYRCRLRIWLLADGVPDVVPDKSTECLGGKNSPMGRVTFSKRSYYKPVTHELDPGQSPEEDDACRGSPAERK